MALRLQISAKEVKAEKIVKPSWYATKIEKVEKQIAKDKESENFVVDVIGQEDDADGVPNKVFFSEKFIQNINPLVRATGPLQGIPEPLSEETGLDPNYDLEKIQGNVVLAQWVTDRGKDGNQKPRNSIVDWAPLPESHPLAHLNSKTSPAPVAAGGFEA